MDQTKHRLHEATVTNAWLWIPTGAESLQLVILITTDGSSGCLPVCLRRELHIEVDAIVNWDPVENTVLANEQVIDGKGWRSGATIERRNMPQWFLRTDYCEELLEGLDDLDWPEQVKVMQRNWIGRSEGYEIEFQIPHLDTSVSVYTTRTDTLFGATYLALAPEHPIVQQIASSDQNVRQFLEDTKSQAASEEALEKSGKEGRCPRVQCYKSHQW